MADENTEAVALEPCPTPWCVGPSARRAIWRTDKIKLHYIHCVACRVFGPFRDTEAEAIAAWNTRAERRAALPADGEPVAWMYKKDCVDSLHHHRQEHLTRPDRGYTETPLYTHPAPPLPADVVEMVERLNRYARLEPPSRVVTEKVFKQAAAMLEAMAGEGWKLPRLTDAMISAALEAHYGKRVRHALGIHGVDLTVNDRNWTFAEGSRRMWKGIDRHLRALPKAPGAGA